MKKILAIRFESRLGAYVRILALVALAWMMPCSKMQAQAPSDAPQAAIDRWMDWKFGLFVHWGPVSMTGGEISWSRNGIGGPPNAEADLKNIPTEVYDNLYKSFYPAQFDADEWVRMARNAGMRYLVFTSKHHDGFVNFDSKLTDYKITSKESPFRRDICAELAEACHRGGLGLGFYYSPPDWHHPDFHANRARYNEYLYGQIRELCTNYGKIDVIWFDMAHGDEWGAERLVKMIRELQPGCIINDRLGGAKGDFATHEQSLGGFDTQHPWETCMTIHRFQWSWNPDGRIKTPDESLVALVRVAGAGGNLLYNLGPMPTGQFEPRQVAVLEEMGKWMAKYGESIYGTRGGPFIPNAWVTTTHKGNTIYVHILRWFQDSVTLPPMEKRIVASSVLTSGTVQVAQRPDGVEIAVPKAQRHAFDTIVKLEVDGPAAEIEAKPIEFGSLSLGKPATASGYHRNEEALNADKALDGSLGTRWSATESSRTAWLEVDLEKPMTFDRALICEHVYRVEKFELQVKDDGAWRTFHTGSTIGEDLLVEFPPVRGRYVRLNIVKASDSPTIWEFQLFGPSKGVH